MRSASVPTCAARACSSARSRATPPSPSPAPVGSGGRGPLRRVRRKAELVVEQQ
ncbi:MULTISPECIES: hypothetical protein [unclassified Streptomyces]|uniref:hypothetical protein n=1 Tax=unclassified Streptomyces TaxID=2593676 RepID=UPI002DD8BD7F|nr:MULTISPECIES: hypothetical protein [unclassified Streptomyces]WSF86246.1 hypothetical protein OIE70_25975 [Streptomyces sp. NBC_01744]WSC37484.1 hypothetical protein OHA08_19310 [Streptomyces sp. NBC_01763]WSC55410.1 hypothetical protein OG808_25880 [Streptomyces sp. NBC_01761]WSD25272.1 hypothetical protein OHA26_18240 [Streptomyces sp. NBC_01751]WSJ52805.1 hypothetical protein OG243_26550 [Streptomyces sp. NBC_01318]